MLTINPIGNIYANSSKAINKKENNKTSFGQDTIQSGNSDIAPTSLFNAYQAYNNITPNSGIKVDYIPPKGSEFKPEELNVKFTETQAKLRELSKNENSWIMLPTKLLNDGTVDTVYSTVEKFKAPFGRDSHLLFVALGNPANADEAARALGVGDNITYCCGVRKNIIEHAIQKAGGDLGIIQVMISSKSGTTFESNDMTYKFLIEKFTDYYKNKGVPEENIPKEISKHFICLTDKNPEAKLKKEAIEKGYTTIDCIDGLASGFGDLSYDIPLLAYAGVKKEDMIKMLDSAELTVKQVLDNPLETNPAGKIAAFDKIAQNNGAAKEQFIFHDSELDLSSTIAQLYRESLRKINLETNTYPRSAHSGLESAINMKLPNQQKNVITNIIPNGGDKTTEATNLENAHIENAKEEGHWQKTISFDLTKDGSGVTPEAMGEFLMLKSFLAFFKNEFEGTNYDLEKIKFVDGYKAIRKEMQNGTYMPQN